MLMVVIFENIWRKSSTTNLTWDDKYRLASQLAGAVSCLHGEEIVHRDLVSYRVRVYFIKIILIIDNFNNIFLYFIV